jgi:hypothetical protein
MMDGRRIKNSKRQEYNMEEYVVTILWDDDEHEWAATSEDVPGLRLTYKSLDALMELVRYEVPEILGISQEHGFYIRFRAERLRPVPIWAGREDEYEDYEDEEDDK